jgi:FixJ family two-component response regulator
MSEFNPTVFIVDDDLAMRDSLYWLIESVGFAVKTYAKAQAFLEEYLPSQPGCLVLDVRLPGLSGLELQDYLLAHKIRLPVIIITGYAEVPMAIRALKQGAVDFLEKPFSHQLLLDRIRQAVEMDVQTRLQEAESADIAARLALLTPREREVMEQVVAGKANKVIAYELDLSQKTVEVHRANMMKKMQANSLAELVHLALRQPKEESEALPPVGGIPWTVSP